MFERKLTLGEYGVIALIIDSARDSSLILSGLQLYTF